MDVDRLIEAGLGQDYHAMTLRRTTTAWIAAGADLRRHVLDVLGGVPAHVEAVGSSSVLDLLAKPIIDLAVGLVDDESLALVTARLTSDGWIYRGDAGADGGHVFVLEARPQQRVAHLHAVRFGGEAWRDYLRLRDVLRQNPEARRRYEAVKTQLAQEEPVDRRAYTVGKTEVVASLLQEGG